MTETLQRRLDVALGQRTYSILIGPDLLQRAGELCKPYLRRGKTVIITDETVAGLHLTTLLTSLTAAGISATTVTVPPGEGSKSFAQYERLCRALLAAKVERHDAIIAFGGGVVGDLAGFVAATLRRGVDFIQIPTTLLAQVDSSVGGKTGINAPEGKNLIGAFHQPVMVLADQTVLGTLPRRELLAGYAEVVKYAFLGDRPFFDWLDTHAVALRDGDMAARVQAVATSCATKAAIVARDEFETGDRALLNLGHTFGHALEAATGYGQRLLHGEGVAIGTALAFAVSHQMGWCPGQSAGRAVQHLRQIGLPTRLADIPGDLPDADGLIALMGQDKKVKDGQMTFIMVRDIGEAFITRDVDMQVVRSVLTQALAERSQ